jgi:murein DD-endopeptidase MepM/ murein hydrolase activator NlpD
VSSRKERDRYVGRRRVPTPPRSRYTAVATTALFGAGIVALATAAAMPDLKSSDPGSLSSIAGSNFSSSRLDATNKASRTNDRAATLAAPNPALDVWRLPMVSYTVGHPFGERTGSLRQGVDLMAPVGSGVYAAHGGTVTLARWYGGYGYAVIIDVGNGVQLVYGHASKLLVTEGQHVDSGALVALSGNSGYSFAPHVHFEVRVNGVATDPVQYMLDHGVSISQHSDSLTL